MDEKNFYPMSQINTTTLRRGNIDIDVTSTQNYNICYIGQSLIKVFQRFSSFAVSNASFQFMLSSLFNCCFFIHNHVAGDLPLGLLNSFKGKCKDYGPRF